jgi:hypothetical protein
MKTTKLRNPLIINCDAVEPAASDAVGVADGHRIAVPIRSHQRGPTGGQSIRESGRELHAIGFSGDAVPGNLARAGDILHLHVEKRDIHIKNIVKSEVTRQERPLTERRVKAKRKIGDDIRLVIGPLPVSKRPKLVQNIRASDNPAKHGEEVVRIMSIQKIIVRQIDEPLRCGRVRVASLLGHGNRSISVAVNVARSIFVLDRWKGINEIDGRIRFAAIDDVKPSTLYDECRIESMDKAILISTAVHIRHEVADRDRLVLLEKFDIHVAEDRAELGQHSGLHGTKKGQVQTDEEGEGTTHGVFTTMAGTIAGQANFSIFCRNNPLLAMIR